MTKQTDLIAYIFDSRPHRLTALMRKWMDASPRFTGFVEGYQDKIRKKIRITRSTDSILDLRAELEAAYCLLNDRRLEVAYEPYASAKMRGPDFAVTYRDNLVFNIEVSRLHEDKNETGEIDLPRQEQRILHTLLEKLGQMQSNMPNLLVIHTQPEITRSIDLAHLMKEVKTRAEAKDPTFYAASSYTSSEVFFKDYLRLSGILLWSHKTQLWVHKQARPVIDERVLHSVSSLLNDPVE